MHCVACDAGTNGIDDLCYECREAVNQLIRGPRSLDDVCEIFGVTDTEVISLELLYEEEEDRDIHDESEEELSL